MGQRLGVRAGLAGDQRQRVRRELAQAPQQSVDRTVGLELFHSTEGGQNALARLVVGADRSDQLQVAVGTDALQGDKRGGFYLGLIEDDSYQ